MAATPYVNLSYPKPRATQELFIRVARPDTTAFLGAWLPKNSAILGVYVIGSVASNAATTATISAGSTVTANEFLNGFDVKTAATGTGYSVAGGAAVGTAMATPLTVDTPVYARYAETGTASTTGGPWWIKIEYATVGPGETVQM